MSLTARRRKTADKALRRFMSTMGVRFDTPDTRRTPARMIEAFSELCANVGNSAPPFTPTTFDKKTDQLVVIGPCSFASLCEHHMLPYYGSCWIGYLPSKSILGLSKFPRFVRWISAKPSTQEALTEEISDQLFKILAPRAVLVLMRASHTCMAIRGVKEPRALTTTHAIRGASASGMKAEFLTLIQNDF